MFARIRSNNAVMGGLMAATRLAGRRLSPTLAAGLAGRLPGNPQFLQSLHARLVNRAPGINRERIGSIMNEISRVMGG